MTKRFEIGINWKDSLFSSSLQSSFESCKKGIEKNPSEIQRFSYQIVHQMLMDTEFNSKLRKSEREEGIIVHNCTIDMYKVMERIANNSKVSLKKGNGVVGQQKEVVVVVDQNNSQTFSEFQSDESLE